MWCGQWQVPLQKLGKTTDHSQPKQSFDFTLLFFFACVGWICVKYSILANYVNHMYWFIARWEFCHGDSLQVISSLKGSIISVSIALPLHRIFRYSFYVFTWWFWTSLCPFYRLSKGTSFKFRAVDSMSSIHFVAKMSFWYVQYSEKKLTYECDFFASSRKSQNKLHKIVFSFVEFIATYSFSASLSRNIEKMDFSKLKNHSALSPCHTNFALL